MVEVVTVIFSGHMIDVPGRAQPRFPPDRVPRVRTTVRAAVAEIDDPDAESISGAACGADLIFCEAWLATDRRLHIFLPRLIEPFLDESVRFAGAEWEAAFHRVTAHPDTTIVAAEPEMHGMEDPHTPNNLRMLERAKDRPPLWGIFVWDGKGGDGPGGTRHMVSELENAGGQVTIIAP